MNRISEITRRDISDLFKHGIEKVIIFDYETVTYPYYGRLEEIDFIKRLYNLKKLPSLDPRYQDAEEDIQQHTVNNDDYPVGWIFEDERFNLKKCTDELYLEFICEIFHPFVRNEKERWKDFFDEINSLLKNDGYELYPSKKISNREVYSWQILTSKGNELFIPYSIRNEELIKQQVEKFSIKLKVRKQILNLLEKYDFIYQTTDWTGWDYSAWLSEDVFSDIKQFYIPKSYNEENLYVQTDNLENAVCYSSPFQLLDIVELFAQYNKDSDFELQLNQLLNLNKISVRLNNGKMEDILNTPIKSEILEPIQETGLKELLQDASSYYDNKNIKIAVEKLWDALERLKTYYSPGLNKRESVNRIVKDMGNNERAYEKLFEDEFHQLTLIGNDFRIRHHETTKINIEDDRYYEYFYKRCLSLVSIAVQYLEVHKGVE